CAHHPRRCVQHSRECIQHSPRCCIQHTRGCVQHPHGCVQHSLTLRASFSASRTRRVERSCSATLPASSAASSCFSAQSLS
ncbi:hypothetical protein T484DRAFT_1628996, partial [Baffinella frigidus]